MNDKINKKNLRLKNARELMLDGDLTAKEYREMKEEIDLSLGALKRKETDLMSTDKNHDKRIDNCVDFLKKIDQIYVSADVETKQRIIGSITSEKLIFENENYRTLKLNKVVELICNDSKGLRKNKKGKVLDFRALSLGVESEGIEPSSKRRINKLSTCLFLD